jgi:catechol 2,3-dioxygenase-like lactoylglutathione lyase family enzyme
MSSPDPSSETSTAPRGPAEDMVVNYFIVSNDIERSRHFYADILGGKVVFSGVPTVVALANSAIVINSGGGPTDDKPTVTLETPPDPDRVSSFPQSPGEGHRRRVRRVERPWRRISDTAEGARVRDPLLHARP